MLALFSYSFGVVGSAEAILHDSDASDIWLVSERSADGGVDVHAATLTVAATETVVVETSAWRRHGPLESPSLRRDVPFMLAKSALRLFFLRGCIDIGAVDVDAELDVVVFSTKRGKLCGEVRGVLTSSSKTLEQGREKVFRRKKFLSFR
jgi:hypothetical protein